LFSAPDPATTVIYPLSLHDALPICVFFDVFHRFHISDGIVDDSRQADGWAVVFRAIDGVGSQNDISRTREIDMLTQETPCMSARSEEHTSELQSRENLVCRLLLEKK